MVLAGGDTIASCSIRRDNGGPPAKDFERLSKSVAKGFAEGFAEGFANGFPSLAPEQRPSYRLRD